MGRKKVPAGGKNVPAEDLLRLLHSQNLGKIRTLVKSGLDPNGVVTNTSCFDNTTWVLRDRKPLVPLLVFACFNGVPAPVLDLLIRLGASPDAATDCGLPAPLAVLCAKVTLEEQRALFQVLRQHRCSTFNSCVRSARNEQPIHVTSKILDLSDWTSPRKVEGVDLLIQFGTFQLPDGELDERAMYEFVATAVRHPCGHKLLDCLWRHFPQQLLPSLPASRCLLLRALTDSWLEPAWRHSEERQHTVSMGLVLRALLEHPALGQPNREAVAYWLRANMTVLLYRPDLVATLLDRCKAPQTQPQASAHQGQEASPAEVSGAGAVAVGPAAAAVAAEPAGPAAASGLFFHPDDRDLVLPVGLLSGPEAAQGDVPLAPEMSLMLAYAVDPDEQLARQGVEMLLSRGARVDLPCRLSSEVLGGDGDGDITPLVAAFMPYHRNQGLVELLWQRYAETQPSLATQDTATRMRASAHSMFLRLPGWQGPLDSAARAAAAAAVTAAEAGGTAGSAAAAAAAAAAAVPPGSLVIEATPLDCSRERLRDLLDSNVLDYVDNRNLDLVEAALTDLLAQLASPQQQPLPAADSGSGGAAAVASSDLSGEAAAGTGNGAGSGGAKAEITTGLGAQLSVVSERLGRAQARLDELYGSERSDAEVAEDPGVWRAEAAVEALVAVQRCLQRAVAANAGGAGADAAGARYELPAGVAFVEVIAARIVGQPEWGFSRGLLLQLGLCQMRRVLRALQAEGAAADGAGVTDSGGANAGNGGGAQGVAAQMEVLRLYYEELLGGLSVPERRLLEDLVTALEAADEEREQEDEDEDAAAVRDAATEAEATAETAAAVAAAPVRAAASPLHGGTEPEVKGAESARAEQAKYRERAPEEAHDEEGGHVRAVFAGEPAPALCGSGGSEGGGAAAGGGGSTGQPLSTCSNSSGDSSSSSCNSNSSSSRSVETSMPDAPPGAAATTGAVAGVGRCGAAGSNAAEGNAVDPAAAAAAAAAAMAAEPQEGLMSPQARQAMHRVMLPGESFGDWTSDDEGTSDREIGGTASGDGGGGDANDGCLRRQARECSLGARHARKAAMQGHCERSCVGGRQDGSADGAGWGEGGSGARKGSPSPPSRTGTPSHAPNLQQLPAEAEAAQQQQNQQPRRHLKGIGAISAGSAGRRRRSRRAYVSENGVSPLDGFSTPVAEGWRDPELLLGGLNAMSLPPNVRHGGGGGGSSGSGSSDSSDRELESYEYLGAAVMLQNYEDVAGGLGSGADRGRYGRYASSAATSAYDTPSEGSGDDDDAGSMLEAQMRACGGRNGGAAAAAAAAAARRLSNGSSSSAESFGSAQGGYGSGSHGYGPEYGLESVGGDMGALESGGGAAGRGPSRLGDRDEPESLTAAAAAGIIPGSALVATGDTLTGNAPPQQHQHQHQQRPGGSRGGGAGNSGRDCAAGQGRSRGGAVGPARRLVRCAPSSSTSYESRDVSTYSTSSGSVNYTPRVPPGSAPVHSRNRAASAAVEEECGGEATAAATASAPVSRASSVAAVSSGGSSLDSTQACIVYKLTAAVGAVIAAGGGRNCAGVWSGTGAADGGPAGESCFREGSRRSGSRSGGPAGSAARRGPSAEAAEATENAWAAERERRSSGGGDGDAAARDVDVDEDGGGWGRRTAAGMGETEAGGARPLVPAGTNGRQRRRLMARRTHALPCAANPLAPATTVRGVCGDAAVAATPLPGDEARAVAPSRGARRRLSPRSGNEADDTSAASSSASRSGGGGRRRSGSQLSYGSEGSVVATIGPARRHLDGAAAVATAVATVTTPCGSSGLRAYDIGCNGDLEGDDSDGSVALRPRNRRPLYERGRVVRDAGGSKAAGATAAANVTAIPAANGRCCGRDSEPVGLAGGGSCGATSGDVSDASSTSTQEWPPRRPAVAAAAAAVTTPMAAAAAKAGAVCAGALLPAELADDWMPPRRRRGEYGSSGTDSDPPGSVGFSGRRPEFGSGSDSESGGVEAESDADGDGGRGARGGGAAVAPLRSLRPPSQSESDIDGTNRSSSSSGGGGGSEGRWPKAGLRGNCRGGAISSTTSSHSSVTSALTPAACLANKVVAIPATGVPFAAAAAAAAPVDAIAIVKDTAAASGTRASASPASTAATAAAAESDGGSEDGDGDDADDDAESPGVSGRRNSAPGSPAVLHASASPSPSPSPLRTAGSPSNAATSSSARPPRPQPHPSPASAPSASRPAAAATPPPPPSLPLPAAPPLPGGADRTLSALLANLATSSNILPRAPSPQWAAGAGAGTGGAVGPGATRSAPEGSGTPGTGAAMAAAAMAAGGKLENCYVLHLSGAAPEEGFAAPPAAVMQVLSDGPCSPEALYRWASELRAALMAASGHEHQRLVVVADVPARNRPSWLSALRAAIVAAVIGAALEAAAGGDAAAAGGGDDARRASGGPGGRQHRRRRQCPEWLRQTVLLLPLCHLVMPYGGAYLYQASTRACQECLNTPAAAATLGSSSARAGMPHLWLDEECMAAAAAFAEAYPGNVYGRAILMQFVSRQISRALLRSPRYGLRAVARSAETLAEALYGSGCGGGSGGGAAATGPCGLLGQLPAAAQTLLLLDDDEGEGEGSVEEGGEDGGEEAEESEGEEEGRALRAASVTCHVMGSALSATRQMQALWRATWPGGHALRLASYSYMASTGYPRAVVSALNWCVPLVLDGVADLSELLAEARLLSYSPTTALIMAEEILAPQRPPNGGNAGGAGAGEDAEEQEAAEQGSDTALAFKHLVNALRAAVEPYPHLPLQPSTANGQPSSPPRRPELVPWSRLCTTQREQMVDELLTLADLLMIAHTVLATLRTALSYAADGGAASVAAAAGALRREVAEVQTMRAAASKMLVERMEAQERGSPEPPYPNHHNSHNRKSYNNQNNRQDQQPQQNRLREGQPQAGAAATATAAAEGPRAPTKGETGDAYGNGGGGSGGGGGSRNEDEVDEQVDERVSWRHVLGLYEHGKTVLQCAADAAAAMLDPQTRAEEAARCEVLTKALLSDNQLLEGLASLAAMPPHHKLPLAPWDPSAAAAEAEAAAAASATADASGRDVDSDSGGGDAVLQAAVTAAAAAAASFSQCNEVLYRLLVLPWSEDGAPAEGKGGGGDGDSSGDGEACTSLAEEFERSSWSIPTLLRGEFRPLTQPRVRRLYDEVRGLAAECLQYLNRIEPLAAAGAAAVAVAAAAMSPGAVGSGGAAGTEGDELGRGADGSTAGAAAVAAAAAAAKPPRQPRSAAGAQGVVVASVVAEAAIGEEDQEGGGAGAEAGGLDDPS